MKKIITFLFVMLSCWTYAQNIRYNHFTADVDYNWSVGDFNNEYGYRGLDFWGIAATGGYRFYMIDGLYISPQVSLYYENHKLDRIYRDIPWGIDATRSVSINPDEGEEISNKSKSHSYEIGFGLGGMVGYNIICGKYRSIDFFTGPYFNCAFKQEEVYKGLKCGLYNKPSMRWRFGVAFNFWRIAVKGSFDLSLTNQYENLGEANVVNVGIGYHF